MTWSYAKVLRHAKVLSIKDKTSKLNCIKFKGFFCAKGTVKRIKSEANTGKNT
jgi:hypothetical protein